MSLRSSGLMSVLMFAVLRCAMPLAAADWSDSPTGVADPIGLGERLALIDYLRNEHDQQIPAGASLADLRSRYWRLHASPSVNSSTPVVGNSAAERDAVRRLRSTIAQRYHTEVAPGLDYEALIALRDRLEAERQQSISADIAAMQERLDRQAAAGAPVTPQRLDQLAQSIVLIVGERSMGSGWVANGAGAVITNAHVVEGIGQQVLVVTDARLDLPPTRYRVAAIADDYDLALLQPADARPRLPPLRLHTDVAITDEVYACGYPLGALGRQTGTELAELSVSVGRVTALRHRGERLFWIQSDCKVSPGNSGGPLIDGDTGHVTGVITIGLRHRDVGVVGNVMTLAVPASAIVEAFGDQLR